MSKMDAMRKALRRMGDDAKPLALQEHIKTRFGIDMSPTVISSYKTYLLKKEGSQSKIIRKAVSESPRVTKSAPAITLEEISAVKALADRIGAEKVKKLAEVLAK